ncbi:MAG: hypothetical protein E7297_04285 [Lachnospiraceae bacterium]|jgi:hypothetical protein|nr:hypothetical protein [Lachnospiraceae bacterium]
MTEEKKQICNSKVRDSGAKLIFENATLCSQFLREYSGIDIFKNVRPEDVEDMTERFAPMFTEEREADVVKKVKIPELGDLFVVTLIEHKASVDYNVSMQLLRYMVYIWEDYEKRMENQHEGISKTKGFKYPPIIPIVYYEDAAEWTSAIHLTDRILLDNVFEDYLPEFKYLLFRLQDQNNQDLIEKQDEISFIMLINRLRNAEEFKQLDLPSGYLDSISQKSPEDVLRVIEKVVAAYLRQYRVSEEEIQRLTDSVRRRKMGQLFENFKGYDLPAEREKAKTEGLIEVTQVVERLKSGETPEAIIITGVDKSTVEAAEKIVALFQ